MDLPSRPLSLAVVGHTNTGKTSLMRTLMRDADFGEVAPSPATTRRVQGAALLVNGKAMVELYDTPGLENASGLFEQLEAIQAGRHDGPSRIRAFLDSAAAGQRFEQEARVLRQVMNSTAALYVIDAREPVLGKYQDELAILAMCARPVLPILNFVASPINRASEWREALARVGLHAVAEFDTVVYAIEAESALWRQLSGLLHRHRATLQALVHDRQQHARLLHQAASRVLADLLIDAAAAHRTCKRHSEADRKIALADLQQAIREREQMAVDQLLALYRFDLEGSAGSELPLTDGAWDNDLFDPTVLAHYAARAGRSTGYGAGIGAVVDLATGGLSLGAGTLIGGLAGAGVGLGRDFGGRLLDRSRGLERLQADDTALTRLAARQTKLIQALNQRGHASTGPIEAGAAITPPWPGPRLPRALVRARLQPELSTLNEAATAETRRERVVAALAADLHSSILPGSPAPARSDEGATTE